MWSHVFWGHSVVEVVVFPRENCGLLAIFRGGINEVSWNPLIVRVGRLPARH